MPTTMAAPPTQRRGPRSRWAPASLLMAALLALLASLSGAQAYVKQLAIRHNKLANITFTEPSTFVFTSTRDVQLATMTTAELANETELDLSNNSLGVIPPAFLQALTNVQTITLSNNVLKTFEPQSFVGLTKLEEINISSTALEALPESFIADCPVLRRITITSNSIREIASRSLANLPSLESINFSKNRITIIAPGAFVNLSAIHTLDMSSNNLTEVTVPPDLFKVSTAWKLLDFGRNSFTSAPVGLQDAVVNGKLSFERNLWVEINALEFANASRVRELSLRSMGIFTVHAKGFSGMTSLEKLDLGDNVISVLDDDAFHGLSNLEVLSLQENFLRRVTFRSFPPKLVELSLHSNRIDEMPTLAPDADATRLKSLNLSRNWVWKLESGSSLIPYTGLVELDLSWNRLDNFTAGVFDPVNRTVRTIHLEYNEIKSVPRSTLQQLFELRDVNITVDVNPGIGTTPDVKGRSQCPGGSVFDKVVLEGSRKMTLYGCIQCGIGSFHDNDRNECRSCQAVSDRAFSAVDGATTCQYCPYSSDLHSNREQCKPFSCNAYCWLTIVVGLLFPIIIMGGKCLVRVANRSKGKQTKNCASSDDADDWVVEQLIQQLQSAEGGKLGQNQKGGGLDGLTLQLYDVNDVEPLDKIYDLPEETQTTVLHTLQENFFQRRNRHRAAMSPATSGATADSDQESRISNESDMSKANGWDDLEWENFHMARILSRNYHGEVFLGEYDNTQVVVKRMMTLRFDVQELFDVIREVDLSLMLTHDNLIQYFGTIWSDAEYFCVITEYAGQGDLHALLEVEATHAMTAPQPQAHVAENASPQNTAPPTTNLMPPVAEPSAMSMMWLSTKLQIIRDVAAGLQYLHSQNICHKDIRSRNILVTDSYRAKLNDLRRAVNGKYLSTTINILNTHELDVVGLSTDKVGSISMPIIAPEVIARSEYQTPADVYAFGIIMAEVWCHRFLAFSNTLVNGVDNEGTNSSQPNGKLLPETVMDSGQRGQLLQKEDERMQRFLSTLRACADLQVNSATGSFSLVSANVNSGMEAVITARIFRTMGECLQRDPRKRPAARDLMERLDRLLETATSRSSRSMTIVHDAAMI